jgi:glyoxylase-like metal-dependent hydrolase (beta-lactamase superfamily II)
MGLEALGFVCERGAKSAQTGRERQSTVQRRAELMGGAGGILEVAPGIIRVTLPVPFEMDGLHVYLLVESDGIIMVDCGPRLPDTLEILDSALREIGASWDRLQGLVLSHWHMDHAGNAAEVLRRSRCWVAIHEKDAAESARYHRNPEGMLGGIPYFLSLGVSEQMARTLAEAPSTFEAMAEDFPVDRAVGDGDCLHLGQRSFRVVWTPGHTRGHLCLLEEAPGVVLVGDHILDPVTPNISFLPGMVNPLGDYRASLHRVSRLTPRLALPGHGRIIERPLERIRVILEHHSRRERAVLGAVTAGAETAAGVARALFGDDHPPLTWRLALLEALSHLEALVVAGDLERIQQAPFRLYQVLGGRGEPARP